MLEEEKPPVPDPTSLTTAQLLRVVGAERDYVNGQLDVVRARLNGMDEATKVLHETVTRTPTDIEQAVGHLRELHAERFGSVATQFKERDTRSERESRDNKVAVDAAFAAQKEAASEQNKSNTLAISKSEDSTKETIDKLVELFRTETRALSDKIDDIKSQISRQDTRITELGALKQGGRETLVGLYALGGFIATLLAVGGFLAAAGVFTR